MAAFCRLKSSYHFVIVFHENLVIFYISPWICNYYCNSLFRIWLNPERNLNWKLPQRMAYRLLNSDLTLHNFCLCLPGTVLFVCMMWLQIIWGWSIHMTGLFWMFVFRLGDLWGIKATYRCILHFLVYFIELIRRDRHLVPAFSFNKLSTGYQGIL
jgi:hypothetical protein